MMKIIGMNIYTPYMKYQSCDKQVVRKGIQYAAK